MLKKAQYKCYTFIRISPHTIVYCVFHPTKKKEVKISYPLQAYNGAHTYCIHKVYVTLFIFSFHNFVNHRLKETNIYRKTFIFFCEYHSSYDLLNIYDMQIPTKFVFHCSSLYKFDCKSSVLNWGVNWNLLLFHMNSIYWLKFVYVTQQNLNFKLLTKYHGCVHIAHR